MFVFMCATDVPGSLTSPILVVLRRACYSCPLPLFDIQRDRVRKAVYQLGIELANSWQFIFGNCQEFIAIHIRL